MEKAPCMGVCTLRAQGILQIVRAHGGQAGHLPLHSLPGGGRGVEGDSVVGGLAAVGLQQAAGRPGLRVRADRYLICNCIPRAASGLAASPGSGSLPYWHNMHSRHQSQCMDRRQPGRDALMPASALDLRMRELRLRQMCGGTGTYRRR